MVSKCYGLVLHAHTGNIILSEISRKGLLGLKKEIGGTEKTGSQLLIIWRISRKKQRAADVAYGSMETFSQTRKTLLLLLERVVVGDECNRRSYSL